MNHLQTIYTIPASFSPTQNQIEPFELVLREKSSPKNPDFFKKRVCICYVENNQTKLCSGCEKEKENGVHEPSLNGSQLTWKSSLCTRVEPTDAYGKISFPGSHSKIAHYIRVEDKTSPSDMIQYIYSKNGWNLSRPQLILSVTGGAKKFTMPHRMRKAFKRGLIKAASSTGAWIITGGTNSGVMRLVGEAVSEELDKYNLVIPVIGIATWGKIYLRDKLINKQNSSNKSFAADKVQVGANSNFYYYFDSEEEAKKQNKTVKQLQRASLINNPTDDMDPMLNANHSHFILVDDGSEGQFAKEIEFRSELEAELRKGRPMKYYKDKEKKIRIHKKKNFLGPNRLNMPENHFSSQPNEVQTRSLKSENEQKNEIENVPMVLICVQGGLNSLETIVKSIEKNIPVLILAESKGCADLIANVMILKNPNNTVLERLVVQYLFENEFNESKQKEKKKAIKQINFIIENKSKNLVNVFRLDGEEDGQDIELAVIRAFLNSRKNEYYENLKLALKWNRIDLAKTDIFTGEETFKPDQLLNLMEMALVENKPEFVELLLDNGVNLKTFLKTRRLYYLYNSHNVKTLEKKSPFFQLYRKKISRSSDYLITFEKIEKFLQLNFFEGFQPKFLPKDDQTVQSISLFMSNANIKETSDLKEFSTFGSIQVDYPEKNLFVWALILNRIELAKIFWRMGEHQIMCSLFASKILKKFAENLHDLSENLIETANYFEETACEVLNIFDVDSDDFMNGIILLQKIPFYNNLDCLQMAVEADCLKFIALPAVQDLITNVWNGQIVYRSGFKFGFKFALSVCSIGLLAPFLVFSEKLPSFNLTNEAQNIANNDFNDNKILKNLYDRLNFVSNKNEFKEKKSTLNDTEEADQEDDDLEDEINNNNLRKKRELNEIKHEKVSYWTRFQSFMNAPKVHFVYEFFTFVIFLFMFSYILLVKFKFREKKNEKPDYWLYLLICYVITLTLNEIYQFCFPDKQNLYKNRYLTYISSEWNFLDLIGCFLFIFGIIFKFSAEYIRNYELFIASRFILAIDLIVWYFRVLHVTLIFNRLGPKIIMLKKMFYDLLFFVVIIFIFVANFGVIYHAILYPESQSGFEMIVEIINLGYWPIFGDLGSYDEVRNKPACNQTDTDLEKNCVDATGRNFYFILHIVYMVLANILLVNLLIAMFTSTFEAVQENTDKIWKYQRYNLVFEYTDSSIFPPPISFIGYLITFAEYMMNKKNNSEKYPLLISERKYAEIFIRTEKHRKKETLDSRLKLNAEKFEILDQRLNELTENRNKDLTDQLQSTFNLLLQKYQNINHSEDKVTAHENKPDFETF